MAKAGKPSIRERPADPRTPRARRVQEVYDRLDDAIGRELERLRREEGTAPSCRRGCSSCCGQHIQTNPAEAHALGQYIRRTFSAKRLRDLKRRTEAWLAWDGRRRTGHAPADPAGGEEATYCPLLVAGACSAYPVRPVICRTHFVSSDPSACRPYSHDDRPLEAVPAVLATVLRAAQPFADVIRDDIEAAGLDYSRSILLLPHWLTIEMGWETDTDP
jgi:Fe-S-cluster containining protein